MSTAGTGHGFAGSRARCTTEGRNEVRRAFWILNAAFHVVHVLQNAALGWCLCCTVRTVSGRVPICVCTRSSLRGLHSACPMSQSPQASQVDQLRRHSIHERFTSAICPQTSLHVLSAYQKSFPSSVPLKAADAQKKPHATLS